MADFLWKFGPFLSPRIPVVLWPAICLLVSRFVGWSRLAAKYPLAPIFLFLPGHPPLHVLRGEIPVDRETSLWRPCAALAFRAVPGVSARLPWSLRDRIEQAGDTGKRQGAKPFRPARIDPRQGGVPRGTSFPGTAGDSGFASQGAYSAKGA